MSDNRVFTDTSDFQSIDSGDDIHIGGRTYTVTGMEKERRFGIEDPKFWVKRAMDKENGDRKIIKLTYFESFMTKIGGVEIRCFRNPDKEGKILKLVEGNPQFMQGKAFFDAKDNNVRIIDIIRGEHFLNHIFNYKMPHRKYFENVLPGVLKKLVGAFKAIRFLHENGFNHGDIRNDHLYIERKTGDYIWIDFDYDYEFKENPFSLDIFGLGNILTYCVGQGFHNYYMIKNDTYTYKDLCERVRMEDFSILEKRRLMNLKKLYPYIPTMLNNILMHFSRGAYIYYESVNEIIEDLDGYVNSI